MRWVVILAACVIALIAAVFLFPVEGVIWRASQVGRLALVKGDQRMETPERAPIAEAVTAVRTSRFTRIIRPLTGGKCHAQALELLTRSGWVRTQATCPHGFFLDYLPRP